MSSQKRFIGLLLAVSITLSVMPAFAMEPGTNRVSPSASQTGTGGGTGPKGPGGVTDQPPGTGGGTGPQIQQTTTIQKPAGGGKGDQQEYMKYELKDVQVTSFQTSGEGSSDPIPDAPNPGATGLEGLSQPPNASASGFVKPGEAEGFNPQPEPPGKGIIGPSDSQPAMGNAGNAGNAGNVPKAPGIAGYNLKPTSGGMVMTGDNNGGGSNGGGNNPTGPNNALLLPAVQKNTQDTVGPADIQKVKGVTAPTEMQGIKGVVAPTDIKGGALMNIGKGPGQGPQNMQGIKGGAPIMDRQGSKGVIAPIDVRGVKPAGNATPPAFP